MLLAVNVTCVGFTSHSYPADSMDCILIIDDFLANGCAIFGLIDLVQQAGGVVEGVGIVIEKGYQEGGHKIREAGYHLESLAIIESMNDQTSEITFRK